MRALPSVSLEYFGSPALGNPAPPIGAAAAGFGAAAGFASAAFGPAGAAAGVAAASDPHSALRKSFHFLPLSVAAGFAALYFALHSCIVSAWAGTPTNIAKPNAAIQPTAFARVIIFVLPRTMEVRRPYPSAPMARDNAAINSLRKYS